MGFQLQDLWEKYVEGDGLLPEAQEDAETPHQQAPASTGSVTHYTYTVPLVRTPFPWSFHVSPVS